VDADPQGSALDWAAARGGERLFPVVGLPKPNLHRELPELAAGYAWCVIDGPAWLTHRSEGACASHGKPSRKKLDHNSSLRFPAL
jgi:chromosome partitioning protein